MASLTRWTWVWVNSGSWWWTGRPGMLRFMGLQRIGHDWATELNWTIWFFYIITTFYCSLYFFQDILYAYSLEGDGLSAFMCKGPWGAHVALRMHLEILKMRKAFCQVSVSTNKTMPFRDECQQGAYNIIHMELIISAQQFSIISHMPFLRWIQRGTRRSHWTWGCLSDS